MNDYTVARREFADLCLSYVGKKESDGSYLEILELYNSISPLPRGVEMTEYYPWCAAFVSAMAYKAGVLDIIPAECSCCAMIRGFEEAGRWVEDDGYTPAVGDVIFYDWEGLASTDSEGHSTADHVGVVVNVQDTLMTVVEGNKNDAVGLRAVSVCSPYICGFGVWEDEKVASDQWPVVRTASVVTVAAYMIRRGSVHGAVKSAQVLLNGLYGAGLEVDGEFGPLTEAAVIGAQKKLFPEESSEWDGVIGPKTWGGLLGNTE